MSRASYGCPKLPRSQRIFQFIKSPGVIVALVGADSYGLALILGDILNAREKYTTPLHTQLYLMSRKLIYLLQQH
jgi:hypothetical protein